MYLIFGDSFSKPFTLLKNCYSESNKTLDNLKNYNNENIYVNTFHGKTMRGVSKINSEFTQYLIKIIKTFETKYHKNINYILFLFGQVDIIFGVFYEILIKKNYDIQKYLVETAKNYINFLNSINFIDNNKKVVFSIHPYLNEDEVIYVLLRYPGIFKNTPFIDREDKIKFLNDIPNNLRKIIFSYDFINNCRILLNNTIRFLCKQNDIIFIDYDKILINKKNNRPIDGLKIMNKLDIHPYYEIIIKYYLSLIKFTNLKPNYKYDIDKTIKEYYNKRIEAQKNYTFEDPIIKNKKNNKKYDNICNQLKLNFNEIIKLNDDFNKYFKK